MPRKVAALRGHFSEFGLIRHRVRVEICLAHRARRRAGDRRSAAVFRRGAGGARPGGAVLRAVGRRAHQGHRTQDQSRRQGRRVLAEGALRGRARSGARRGVHPLRVHVRGHQQSRACAGAGGGAQGRAAAGAARRRGRLARAGARECRRADAVAHARPAGHADHARQGNRQRLCAHRAADRRHRARADQGQGQRRRGQLQRAPGRLSGRRLGTALRHASSRGSASNSIPTRRRSSRTTTWPNSSTRSRAPTPS